jgi:hypothetical protein
MRRNQVKIIGLLLVAVSLAIGLYVWRTEVGDDEMVVLSGGYRGVVFIFYSRKDGEPMKYENGKRLYEIPPNGILKTQFSPNVGWHHFGEYYYKESDKLVRIPYAIDDVEVESDRSIGSHEVRVCCESSGKAGRNPNEEPIVFGQFYIGTKEEISNASEKREKINPADLVN